MTLLSIINKIVKYIRKKTKQRSVQMIEIIQDKLCYVCEGSTPHLADNKVPSPAPQIVGQVAVLAELHDHHQWTCADEEQSRLTINQSGWAAAGDEPVGARQGAGTDLQAWCRLPAG